MAGTATNLQKQLISRLAADKEASILIITLWSLFLLTSFAVILGYEVRQELTLVKRLEARDALHYICEAGVKRAIVELKREPFKSYDALTDNWSNNVAAFKEVAIGNGQFSILYDDINEQPGRLETGYGLMDEERKININKVGPIILERLFRIVLGLDEVGAQELAASIVDWRDNDSELSLPLGSAEDPYYRNLQYPYEAKDAEFEVLDEVLLVKGMDRDIFEKLKNYITIYGNGRVNINTASKITLLALGINEDIVDKILSFRKGQDGISATPDDNIFDTAANIIPKLSQFCQLGDSEIAQLSVVVEQNLSTNSDNFMVRTIAKLDDRNTARINCVINRSGKVLYWQES